MDVSTFKKIIQYVGLFEKTTTIPYTCTCMKIVSELHNFRNLHTQIKVPSGTVVVTLRLKKPSKL